MIDTFPSTQKYVLGIFSITDNVDKTCKKKTIPVIYIKNQHQYEKRKRQNDHLQKI